MIPIQGKQSDNISKVPPDSNKDGPIAIDPRIEAIDEHALAALGHQRDQKGNLSIPSANKNLLGPTGDSITGPFISLPVKQNGSMGEEDDKKDDADIGTGYPVVLNGKRVDNYKKVREKLALNNHQAVLYYDDENENQLCAAFKKVGGGGGAHEFFEYLQLSGSPEDMREQIKAKLAEIDKGDLDRVARANQYNAFGEDPDENAQILQILYDDLGKYTRSKVEDDETIVLDRFRFKDTIIPKHSVLCAKDADFNTAISASMVPAGKFLEQDLVLAEFPLKKTMGDYLLSIPNNTHLLCFAQEGDRNVDFSIFPDFSSNIDESVLIDKQGRRYKEYKDHLNNTHQIFITASKKHPDETKSNTYTIKSDVKEDKTITLAYYPQWKDFMAVEDKDINKLVTFIDHMKGDEENWLMCRAGVGRSGTSAVILKLLEEARKSLAEGRKPFGDSPEQFLKDAIADLRIYRGQNAVQKPEQYDMLKKIVRCIETDTLKVLLKDKIRDFLDTIDIASKGLQDKEGSLLDHGIPFYGTVRRQEALDILVRDSKIPNSDDFVPNTWGLYRLHPDDRTADMSDDDQLVLAYLDKEKVLRTGVIKAKTKENVVNFMMNNWEKRGIIYK